MSLSKSIFLKARSAPTLLAICFVVIVVASLLWWYPNGAVETRIESQEGSRASQSDLSRNQKMDANASLLEEFRTLMAIEDVSERERNLQEFLAHLDPAAFPRLRDVFREIPEEINIDIELGLFVGYWAYHDGAAAIGFVDELYPRFNGLVLPTRDALMVWGRTDPQACASYVAAISDERSAWKRICFDGAANSIAPTQPQFAMEWAGRIQSEYRWIALDSVVQRLPSASLSRAESWLISVVDDNDNPMEIYNAARTLIQRSAHEAPERILEWTHHQLPAGKLRDKAINESIYGVARFHPDVVANFLARDDYREALLVGSESRFDEIIECALMGINESSEYELALQNIDLIRNLNRRETVLSHIRNLE